MTVNTRRWSALALLSFTLAACGNSAGPGGTTTTGPTVTAVSPDIGLSAGGTTVTLTGTNFKAGMSVKFGGTLSSTVNVTSATSLTAISPAAAGAGKVDVTVSDGAVVSPPSSADQFGYVAFAEFPVAGPSDSRNADIVTGPDGNLWTTQSNGNRIVRITPAGAATAFPLPSESSYPQGITSGPDGNVWFTEFVGHSIGRITPAGVITEFSLSDSINYPQGITSGPDGNLWFTESTGNRIGRITPAGVITEFTVPTAKSFPQGITSGPDGNVWFTENAGNKIGRITPAGVITEFPVATAASSLFGITAGPDGNLWFTEQGGNKIGRITRSGVIVEFPTGEYPVDITTGPDGNLWFIRALSSAVGVLKR